VTWTTATTPNEINEAPGWKNYATKAGLYLMQFDDDWAYSFPGWYADCAISSLLHKCMYESTICIRALKLNLPNVNLFDGVGHDDNYNIYRDDFSQHGEQICRLLEQHGGPACAASREEAWRRACKVVNAISERPKEGVGFDSGLDISDCFECKGVSKCMVSPSGDV
jgi:hypothetical protein